MAIASAALTASVVGGIAIAQTDTTVIGACVAESSGNVRIVSGAGDCRSNETFTTWNQKGEKGDPGVPGAPGQDATAPAGAVMFFNLPSCPTGWAELTAARGRYLVGMPSGGTLGGTAGTPLANLENRAVGMHNHTVFDPGHSHRLDAKNDQFVAGASVNVVAGNAGVPNGSAFTHAAQSGIHVNAAGSVAGTNAPYLQLLVCQKS